MGSWVWSCYSLACHPQKEKIWWKMFIHAEKNQHREINLLLITNRLVWWKLKANKKKHIPPTIRLLLLASSKWCREMWGASFMLHLGGHSATADPHVASLSVGCNLFQATSTAALHTPLWLHMEMCSVWCPWAAAGQPAPSWGSPGLQRTFALCLELLQPSFCIELDTWKSLLSSFSQLFLHSNFSLLSICSKRHT